jgi:hypothetical protein
LQTTGTEYGDSTAPRTAQRTVMTSYLFPSTPVPHSPRQNGIKGGQGNLILFPVLSTTPEQISLGRTVRAGTECGSNMLWPLILIPRATLSALQPRGRTRRVIHAHRHTRPRPLRGDGRGHAWLRADAHSSRLHTLPSAGERRAGHVRHLYLSFRTVRGSIGVSPSVAVPMS